MEPLFLRPQIPLSSFVCEMPLEYGPIFAAKKRVTATLSPASVFTVVAGHLYLRRANRRVPGHVHAGIS